MRRLCLSLVLVAGSAWACATVSVEPISIDSEEALIVWDAPTRTQHFVRRAQFRTSGGSAGFLVPTPTVPTLAEVPDAIFDGLRATTAPIHRNKFEFMPSVLCVTMSGSDAAAIRVMSMVDVVHRQKVAGYDAAILQASDAQALAGWLKKEGFPETPELRAWLKPFVEKGWIITAFKLDGANPRLDAVHMSFKTDRPFYPYSQPKGSSYRRPFLLHILAPEGMTGTVGRFEWHPRYFAGRVRARDVAGAEALPFVPEQAYLTSYYEYAPEARHLGEELYFAPQPDMADFRTEIVKVFTIHGEVILFGMLVGYVVWRTFRRSSARKDAAPPQGAGESQPVG